MAAGADAGAEASFRRATDELGGAKARVEVVAGTGGDEGLGYIGPGNPPRAVAGRASGGFFGVNDHGGEIEALADLLRHLAETGFAFGDDPEAERGEDLLGFFQI